MSDGEKKFYIIGTGRPIGELEAPAALEHDLPVVLHLLDVRPVVVQAHVADQKDLGVIKPGSDRPKVVQ